MEYLYTVEVDEGRTVQFYSDGTIIQGTGTWRALSEEERKHIAPDNATLLHALDHCRILSFSMRLKPIKEEPSQ